MYFSEQERRNSQAKKDSGMAYSNQPPIQLHRDINQQSWDHQSQGTFRQEQRPPQKAKEPFLDRQEGTSQGEEKLGRTQNLRV